MSNTSLSQAHVRPDPDVICQRMGQTIVLLHLRTDRFYELNSTAARFWELLNEHTDTDTIQQVLLQEFDVEPDQLDNQVSALLASLKTEGLIIDSQNPKTQEEQ